MEDTLQKRVVKKGDEWCVVHSQPPNEGKIIKCFPTKEQALRQHAAIIISQQQRKKELNVGLYVSKYHAELIHRKQQRVIIVAKKYNIANINFLYCDNEFSYGTLKVSASKEIISYEEFNKLRKYHKITDEEFKTLDLDYPVFIHFIKEVRNFDSPIEIDLPEGTKSFIENPIQYLRPKDIIKSIATLSKEEYKKIVGDYKLKPLPDKYYKSPKKGDFWAQMHIRGITSEEHKDCVSGKIKLWQAIRNHSIHIDLRCKFSGLESLLQFVLVENDIDSYLKVMKGSVDPKSNQVSKGLIIVKDSVTEPSDSIKKNKKEMLLDEAGAKKVADLIIESKSYWIEPGGVGATKDKYGYMSAIVLGKVESGTMRCMTRNTMITVKNKRGIITRQAIGGIVERKEDVEVLTPNGFVGIKDYIEVETKDLLSIELENGSKINCDALHPSYTLRNGSIEKVHANELKVGDLIPIHANGYEGTGGNYDLGRFIGLYLAEGSGHKDDIRNMQLRFSFNRKETELITFIKKFSEQLGANVNVRNDKRNNGTCVDLSQAGALVGLIRQFVQKDKSLYNRVFGLSRECRIGIIEGMHEGDNNGTGNKGSYKQILNGSKHKKLMKDIFHLCFSVGEVASFRIQNSVNNEKYGLNRAVSFNLNNLKYGGAWKQYEFDGQRFIKVKSIDINPKHLINSGIKKLYDVELESDHRIVLANGIITSNSDFKELFLHSEGTNKDLWNGRFVFKAFKSPSLWWCFKAIKTPFPSNPFCEIDSGNFNLLPADRLKYFKKEDYKKWEWRSKKC